MVENVVVSLGKLLKDYKSVYTKSFGIHYFIKDSDSIEYELVIDENARFMNLFGMSVNINDGSIALGLSPNPNRYIRIGNVYDDIKSLCRNRSIQKVSNDDLKILLEGLKLCPREVYENIDFYNKCLIDSSKTLKKDKRGEFKSIILNMVIEKDRSRGKFRKSDVLLNREIVPKLIVKYVETLSILQSISRDFFGTYILEKDIKNVWRNAEIPITDIIDSKQPNVETKFIRYLSYIPYDYLSALRSYGFGVKDRNILIKSVENGRRGIKYSDALYFGEVLSSFAYIDDSAQVPAVVKTYNLLDMLRAVGAENDIIFSIEILAKYKNTSLYRSLSEKYEFNDIFKDIELDEKDFLLGIKKYTSRMVNLYDRCGMYSRDVTLGQYNFISLVERPIINAGRVFEKSCDMILKRF